MCQRVKYISRFPLMRKEKKEKSLYCQALFCGAGGGGRTRQATQIIIDTKSLLEIRFIFHFTYCSNTPEKYFCNSSCTLSFLEAMI